MNKTEILLILIMLVGFSFAATNVSDCGVISTPGEYELNTTVGTTVAVSPTLIAGSSTCIHINISNVSFSCNGFNIDANATPGAFNIGLGVGLSAGPTLENITIMNCPNITNYSFTGVYIRNVENSSVTNNTFFANADGLTFRSVFNLTITNNTGRNNVVSAFNIPASVSTTSFINNLAYDNQIGFDASKGGVNLTFTDNYAYNNTAEGFIITSTEGADIVNNRATQNDIGFSLTPFLGTSFNVTDNIADLNRNGFEIYTFQLILRNNSALSNTENGLYVDSANESEIDGMYFSNNAVDLFINESLSDSYSIDFANMIFDNPFGTFTNYTNLSIQDVVSTNSSYEVFWSSTGATIPTGYSSFNGMYVNITNLTTNVSIDVVDWYWLDSQLGGINESRLHIFDFNGSVWADVNATLNASGNLLSVANLSNFSKFGVFSQNLVNPPVTSPGGGSSSTPSMSGHLSSTCSDNTITFSTSNLDSVYIDDDVTSARIYSGPSDSSPSVTFTAACDGRVHVYATKSGYRPYDETFNLISCSSCAPTVPPPTTNSSNSSTPTPTPTPTTPPIPTPSGGCTSDVQCSASEMCSSGSCVPVSGSCGRVSNHTFIPYECGEGIGCMLCPTGFRCESNICLRNDLIANDSGFVGERIVVHVNEYMTNQTRNCNNCNLAITDSTGRMFNGRTDAAGNYTLPLEIVGEYSISLVYGNTTIKRISVQALPRQTEPAPEPTPVSWLDILASYWWLLLLILLIIAYILYRRQQQQSGRRR